MIVEGTVTGNQLPFTVFYQASLELSIGIDSCDTLGCLCGNQLLRKCYVREKRAGSTGSRPDRTTTLVS